MAPPPTLQELIEIVRQDASSDQPLDQLVAAAAAAAQLEETTDALLGHFVDRCRRDGRSWTEISAALGVTKQAVHKRFATAIATHVAAATQAPTFERFTDRARRVMAESSKAAISLGDDFVGTEHLLLALFTEPEGIAGRALAAMDVSEDTVPGRGRPSPGRPSLSCGTPWLSRSSSATTTSAPSTYCWACTGTTTALPRRSSRRPVRSNPPPARTLRRCCAGKAQATSGQTRPEPQHWQLLPLVRQRWHLCCRSATTGRTSAGAGHTVVASARAGTRVRRVFRNGPQQGRELPIDALRGATIANSRPIRVAGSASSATTTANVRPG
jgi:Clp amino terminal domain, pathogenicity island component